MEEIIKAMAGEFGMVFSGEEAVKIMQLIMDEEDKRIAGKTASLIMSYMDIYRNNQYPEQLLEKPGKMVLIAIDKE